MPSVTALYNEILNMIGSATSQFPINSRSIEGRLNVGGPAVREAVRFFRRHGEPIIATDSGYYIATRPEEVDIVIRDLTARIASMSKTVAALQRTKGDRFGTQEVFNFASCGGSLEDASKGAASGIPGAGSFSKEEELMPDVHHDNRSVRKPEGMDQGTEDQALIDVLAVELTV
jgi:hypothetical protein